MKGNSLIFKNRNFRLLWGGQVLSQAGSRMYQIGITWWILSLGTATSSRDLGVFLILGALPSILFVKQIGKIIDKIFSKKILIRSDLIAAITAAIVALFFHFGIFNLVIIFAAGFLIALCQAFIDPSLNKALPDLVDEKDLESGVAFISTTQSLANFGGAVAGAFLVDLAGIYGVVVINAMSYFVSALCTYYIRFEKSIEIEAGSKQIDQEQSIWGKLNEMPLLRNVLIGFGLVNFFGTPTLIIMPLYTKNILHASASALGGFEACLWIGLIIGTFSSKFFDFFSSTLKLGGVCLGIFGFCLFLPGYFINFWLYAVLLFGAGFSLGLLNVKFITLFHQIVGAEIKGRFFALLQALISFTFPIAFLVFGILGDLLPTTQLCLIQGSGIVILSFAYFYMARRESEIESYKQQAQEIGELG